MDLSTNEIKSLQKCIIKKESFSKYMHKENIDKYVIKKNSKLHKQEETTLKVSFLYNNETRKYNVMYTIENYTRCTDAYNSYNTNYEIYEDHMEKSYCVKEPTTINYKLTYPTKLLKDEKKIKILSKIKKYLDKIYVQYIPTHELTKSIMLSSSDEKYLNEQYHKQESQRFVFSENNIPDEVLKKIYEVNQLKYTDYKHCELSVNFNYFDKTHKYYLSYEFYCYNRYGTGHMYRITSNTFTEKDFNYYKFDQIEKKAMKERLSDVKTYLDKIYIKYLPSYQQPKSNTVSRKRLI